MGYNSEYYFDARKLTSVSARYWSLAGEMVREINTWRPRRHDERVPKESHLFLIVCVWACEAVFSCRGDGHGLAAQAGVMTKETMLQSFPSPIIGGDKDAELQI